MRLMCSGMGSGSLAVTGFRAGVVETSGTSGGGEPRGFSIRGLRRCDFTSVLRARAGASGCPNRAIASIPARASVTTRCESNNETASQKHGTA
jgi:hypothetical protein